MWLLLLMLIFCSGLVDCDDPQCYNELGCFPTDYPWSGPMRPDFPVPESPQTINTKIYCYTRDSPVKYNVTLWPQIHLEGCPFLANRATMILTHGFSDTAKRHWPTDLKDNYLEATDANVFVVDWLEGARLLSYSRAASNARVVGAEIARFVRFLKSEYGMKASDLHLIGHSLGAQVMSYAAKNTSGVWRLTGLDPAQPAFEGCDKIVRLDITDANFVDVLHTNGQPFVPLLGLGYINPHVFLDGITKIIVKSCVCLGHVDFYVNGGGRQPLCEVSNLGTIATTFTDFLQLTVDVLETTLACSHIRARQYFSDSLLNNCNLWGHRATFEPSLLNIDSTGMLDSYLDETATEDCDADSYIPMGLNTPDYKPRGVFAVKTPLVAPFCYDPETSNKITSQISQQSTKMLQNLLGVENDPIKKMPNFSIL